MSVSVSVDDADDARRVFDALADGGQVTALLTETFFTGVRHVRRPLRGAVDDRRGIARHAMT